MLYHKLRQYLDSFGAKYVTISHSPAFTATDTAKSAHVTAQELAKVVMVKIDDRMAMVVLPANRVVDLQSLQELAAADTIRLANEREFTDLFPECEPGAMPPFGNMYALPVYADISLRQDEKIVFNAGSHSELVQMSYKDWENLVKPKVANISQPRREPREEPPAGLWAE